MTVSGFGAGTFKGMQGSVVFFKHVESVLLPSRLACWHFNESLSTGNCLFEN